MVIIMFGDKSTGKTIFVGASPETVSRLREASWDLHISSGTLLQNAREWAGEISESALIRYLDYLDQQKRRNQ